MVDLAAGSVVEFFYRPKIYEPLVVSQALGDIVYNVLPQGTSGLCLSPFDLNIPWLKFSQALNFCTIHGEQMSTQCDLIELGCGWKLERTTMYVLSDRNDEATFAILRKSKFRSQYELFAAYKSSFSEPCFQIFVPGPFRLQEHCHVFQENDEWTLRCRYLDNVLSQVTVFGTFVA